jgi:hypothetical protein
MDNLPNAVLVGGSIIGDGNLARATAMDCSTRKGERLRRTQSHDVAHTTSVVDAIAGLAGEVAAVGVERTVANSRNAIWLGLVDDDVGSRKPHQASGRENGVEEHLERYLEAVNENRFVPDEWYGKKCCGSSVRLNEEKKLFKLRKVLLDDETRFVKLVNSYERVNEFSALTRGRDCTELARRRKKFCEL